MPCSFPSTLGVSGAEDVASDLRLNSVFVTFGALPLVSPSPSPSSLPNHTPAPQILLN